MAGLNDKRMLGTESGRIRREARRVQRAGGSPDALLNLASKTRLAEGSGITSSEENIAADEYKIRTQAGLNAQRKGSILGQDSRPSFGADLDRSALAKTDPAARQRAYDRGASLGVSQEDIDRRLGGALPPATTPPVAGTVPPVAGTVPPVAGTVPPVATNKASSLLARSPGLTKPRPSLIDGRPAADVLKEARGRVGEDEPTDPVKDRQSAIEAARTESAGNPSVTRGSVIDRINKQRVQEGQTAYGDDIYKDIAGADSRGAQARRAEGKAKLGAEASAAADTVMGEAIRETPLQKALGLANTRYGPPAPSPVAAAAAPAPVQQRAPAPAEPAPTSLGDALSRDARSVQSAIAGVAPALGKEVGALAKNERDAMSKTVTGAKDVLGSFASREKDAMDKLQTGTKKTLSALGSRAVRAVPGSTGSYLSKRFKL